MTHEREVRGCGGCNPNLPIPADALTVREMEERYAREQERRTRPPQKHRIGEWVANLVLCPACLLPRFMPQHWLTCR